MIRKWAESLEVVTVKPYEAPGLSERVEALEVEVALLRDLVTSLVLRSKGEDK